MFRYCNLAGVILASVFLSFSRSYQIERAENRGSLSVILETERPPIDAYRDPFLQAN
jgi:hypothetical protein